jgi:WD40 repeat protein
MSFCNLLTGRVERRYEGIHDGRTTVVEWRDNDQSLITCGEDGMVKYWDIRRMDECIFLSDTVYASSSHDTPISSVHGGCGHHGHVTGCVFSPHGDVLMTSGWDQTIHVWSMIDMKLIHVRPVLPTSNNLIVIVIMRLVIFTHLVVHIFSFYLRR